MCGSFLLFMYLHHLDEPMNPFLLHTFLHYGTNVTKKMGLACGFSRGLRGTFESTSLPLCDLYRFHNILTTKSKSQPDLVDRMEDCINIYTIHTLFLCISKYINTLYIFILCKISIVY